MFLFFLSIIVIICEARVVSLTWVATVDMSPISELTDGSVFDLGRQNETHWMESFNVLASVDNPGEVAEIQFTLTGQETNNGPRSEESAPYLLFGNNPQAGYLPWGYDFVSSLASFAGRKPSLGMYVLTAQSYKDDGMGGLALDGQPLTVSFTVVQSTFRLVMVQTRATTSAGLDTVVTDLDVMQEGYTLDLRDFDTTDPQLSFSIRAETVNNASVTGCRFGLGFPGASAPLIVDEEVVPYYSSKDTSGRPRYWQVNRIPLPGQYVVNTTAFVNSVLSTRSEQPLSFTIVATPSPPPVTGSPTPAATTAAPSPPPVTGSPTPAATPGTGSPTPAGPPATGAAATNSPTNALSTDAATSTTTASAARPPTGTTADAAASSAPTPSVAAPTEPQPQPQPQPTADPADVEGPATTDVDPALIGGAAGGGGCLLLLLIIGLVMWLRNRQDSGGGGGGLATNMDRFVIHRENSPRASATFISPPQPVTSSRSRANSRGRSRAQSRSRSRRQSTGYGNTRMDLEPPGSPHLQAANYQTVNLATAAAAIPPPLTDVASTQYSTITNFVSPDMIPPPAPSSSSSSANYGSPATATYANFSNPSPATTLSPNYGPVGTTAATDYATNGPGYSASGYTNFNQVQYR